jgi:hypothetical protein
MKRSGKHQPITTQFLMAGCGFLFFKLDKFTQVKGCHNNNLNDTKRNDTQQLDKNDYIQHQISFLLCFAYCCLSRVVYFYCFEKCIQTKWHCVVVLTKENK